MKKILIIVFGLFFHTRANIDSYLYKAIKQSELEVVYDLLSQIDFLDENTKDAYIKISEEILELRKYDIYIDQDSSKDMDINSFVRFLGKVAILGGVVEITWSYKKPKIVTLCIGAIAVGLGILKATSDIKTREDNQKKQLYQNAQEICHLIRCKKISTPELDELINYYNNEMLNEKNN